MKVRRITIVILLSFLLLSVIVFLFYYFKTKKATENLCEEFLLIDSKVILPSEYCLEYDNKIIETSLLDELIESLCTEANALMTESFAKYYCELISTKMNDQAAKKYTVSSKERLLQRSVSFKLRSFSEIEIKAEVKRSSTEFSIIDGQLSQYVDDSTGIYLYTFIMRYVSGAWKVDSVKWTPQ